MNFLNILILEIENLINIIWLIMKVLMVLWFIVSVIILCINETYRQKYINWYENKEQNQNYQLDPEIIISINENKKNI